MIEAKELRIGNLVNYEQKTHRIIGINQTECESIWVNSKTHLDVYTHKYSQTEPIPITEEWLLKFGFTEYADYYIYLHDFQNQSIIVKFFAGSWVFYQGFLNDFNELTGVKYIHQLQNLYFALTGQQLEIK